MAAPPRQISMTPRRTVFAVLAAAGLALAGCAGDPDSAAPAAPAANPTPTKPANPAEPGDGVTSTTFPSPTATPSFGGDENAQLVTAKPGTINPRPVSWQRAKPSPDGRSVRIFFVSGVEPCYVLDHVKVSYLDQVVITLYEGSRHTAKRQVCIDIGVFKAVDVPLDQPLGARTVVDGAPR